MRSYSTSTSPFILSMVDRRVLTQLANDSHYATTQRELQMSIQSNNAFKEEGKFSVIIFCIKFNITKLALLVVQRLHTLEC
jgi:hypothetical protein